VNNRDFPTRLLFNNVPAPPNPRWADLEIKHGELEVQDEEQAWRFRLFNLREHLSKMEALWTVHVVGHVGPLLMLASQEEDEFPWEGHDNDEAETIVILNGQMRFVVKETKTDREICDVHLDSGDVLVQPGETSHKAYGDGEQAMLAIIEFAH
jgi:mannose-6-phosphate isomerase-like protein (cupin superfamily)